MCEMCKPVTNKNTSFLKKCTHADTQSQMQNKQRGINTVHSQWVREGITQHIYSETNVFIHKHTHTVAVGQKSRPAFISVRDWEPSSLKAGPVERGPDAAGLTHSFVGGLGGGFSSWNTQGLAALTSFNLICIRAVFGGKHRFSLWGDIWGHGKQQQTVDFCILPLQRIHRGRQGTVFPDRRHTYTQTQTHTIEHISFFLHNYVYITKSNLSNWNAFSTLHPPFHSLISWNEDLESLCSATINNM